MNSALRMIPLVVAVDISRVANWQIHTDKITVATVEERMRIENETADYHTSTLRGNYSSVELVVDRFKECHLFKVI